MPIIAEHHLTDETLRALSDTALALSKTCQSELNRRARDSEETDDPKELRRRELASWSYSDWATARSVRAHVAQIRKIWGDYTKRAQTEGRDF